MPIRAILFDLDNTLILEDAATMDALRAAALAAHDRTGLDPDALAAAVAERADAAWKASPMLSYGETYGVWWGEALWGDFSGEAEPARALRGFVPGFRAAVWRDALAKMGRIDGARADELSRAYIRIRRSREEIDPEAGAVVAALARDHRLAIVTNGAGDVQREKLSRTPFARHLSAIVISMEEGIGKPDPRIFQRALDLMGVAATEAVMVGDSLVRDVAGARRAGIATVWLDRKLWDEPRTIVPDARIERLSDLPAALDALARRPASPRATS
jgi:putative hydrolase of the HAD superfamily